jgi:hypothetical protein
MKIRIKLYPNNAYVTFEKTIPDGYYDLRVRNPAGYLIDRVRCDDYKSALDYYKSFKAIARNA